MFISIIIDNFRIVRAEVHKVDDDNQDVFINFLKKLHRWFGKFPFLEILYLLTFRFS
jgi:hypothetical protein